MRKSHQCWMNLGLLYSNTCTKPYAAAPEQQTPPLNMQNQALQNATQPQAPTMQQQPVAFRKHQGACFNCGDPSHFVTESPLKDRARKPLQ